MTDEQLLRAAARVAGVDTYGMTYMLDYCDSKDDGNYLYGNNRSFAPLTRGGEALWLAVECLPFHILQYSPEDYEHCKYDIHAATRRAIVRAVAALDTGETE